MKKTIFDTDKFQGKTFEEIYSELVKISERPLTPSQIFRNEMAAITGMTPYTIQTWGLGYVWPNRLAQEKLAMALDSKPEVLFPTKFKYRSNPNRKRRYE
jgi:hypothetical protein